MGFSKFRDIEGGSIQICANMPLSGIGCGMAGATNAGIREIVKKGTQASAEHIDFLPFPDYGSPVLLQNIQ